MIGLACFYDFHEIAGATIFFFLINFKVHAYAYVFSFQLITVILAEHLRFLWPLMTMQSNERNFHEKTFFFVDDSFADVDDEISMFMRKRLKASPLSWKRKEINQSQITNNSLDSTAPIVEKPYKVQ